MPEELRNRINGMNLTQIDARIAEIDAEVRTLTSVEEIDQRTEELKELKARKAELEAAITRAAEADAIQRGSINAAIVGGGNTVMPQQRTYDASSPEYRSAWLKALAVDERGNHLFGDMTVEERSAFTFMTSNSSAVVPTETQNRIIDRVKAEAPMLEDADLSNIEGVYAIPVRTAISQGDAAVVGEGAANDDEQDTFDLITLAGVDIKKHAIMTRRMQFQSIDAFEQWLVADISKRIMVAKERVIIARLDGSAPATGESANNKVKIDSNNVLTSQAYTDAVIRNIMSLIDENGEVVIYANQKTIWNGLASIVDAENKKIMIPNAMVDPVVQGRIYGASIKKDSNLSDNVAYFGVKGAIKANNFAPLEVTPAIEPKTANRIFTGSEIFDAGLENPKAFVKVTFTTGQ